MPSLGPAAGSSPKRPSAAAELEPVRRPGSEGRERGERIEAEADAAGVDLLRGEAALDRPRTNVARRPSSGPRRRDRCGDPWRSRPSPRRRRRRPAGRTRRPRPRPGRSAGRSRSRIPSPPRSPSARSAACPRAAPPGAARRSPRSSSSAAGLGGQRVEAGAAHADQQDDGADRITAVLLDRHAGEVRHLRRDRSTWRSPISSLPASRASSSASRPIGRSYSDKRALRHGLLSRFDKRRGRIWEDPP